MHNRSLTAAASVGGGTAGARAQRRVLALIVGTLLALGMLAAPATAHTDEPHSHALLLHFDGVSYKRCVDLANSQRLPNHVHHDSVHTGDAGFALQGAGHLVVPYTCEQVAAFFG